MADMYLVRLVLPDRPGSLGAVATAMGLAEADIISIDVVERRPEGTAVDDFIVDLPPHRDADALVTASQSVDGVKVEWVSRYAAGGDVMRDLEAVEAMTSRPSESLRLLTELAPAVFMADWALLLDLSGSPTVLESTQAAPDLPPLLHGEIWPSLEVPTRLDVPIAWQESGWSDVVAAAPIAHSSLQLLIGRSGGPPVLDSELLRLGHLVSLAVTVERTLSD
jgi:ACT domain